MWFSRRVLSNGWWFPLLALALTGLVWGASQLTRTLSTGQEVWIRAIACAVMVGLLVAAMSPLRTSRGLQRVTLACMVCALLVLGSISTNSGIRRHLGSTQAAHTWNFFHYYLGSKYFAELGYDDLYPEMLKADHETIRHFRKATRYRRQTDYAVLPTGPVLRQARNPGWTESRWEEFKRDVNTIARTRDRNFWRGPFTDRGYNAPPGWSVMGGSLAKVLSPASALHVALILVIDPLLLFMAFLWSIGAYGLTRSMLILIAAASWVGCLNLFGGMFLLYDWFAAAWAAAAAMKRGHWAVAGALIAYGASVRVFPAVLLVGPFLQSLYALVRTRRIPKHLVRLLASGTASLVLLCSAATLLNGRGTSAWTEFSASIAEHNYHHKFTETRVGLPFVTTASFETGIDETTPRSERIHIYDDNALLRHGLQLGLLGLFVFAVRRQDTHDAALLGLVAMFALTVSSRYYGVAYALLLLRHLGNVPARAPLAESKTWLYFALGFWVLWLGALAAPLAGFDSRSSYMTANFGILGYLIVSLLVAARVKPAISNAPARS